MVLFLFDYYCFSSETTSKLTNQLLETKNRRSKNVIEESDKVLCTGRGTNKQINRGSTNTSLKTNCLSEEPSYLTSMNNSYCKRKRKTKSVYVRKSRVEKKDRPNSEKKSKQTTKKDMIVQSDEQTNAEIDKNKFGFSNSALNKESDQMEAKLKPISFDCTVCGKQFREKSHLATHSRAHVDIRNFKCNECGNSYKTKTNLLFHMKTHEEAPYICKKCDKTFPERKVLMRHIRVVHRYVYFWFF